MVKSNSKSFEKHFFDLFLTFFFRLGKNKKTTVNPLRNNFLVFFFRLEKNQKPTVNPLRNNFGLFWRICFAIGGGIKKKLPSRKLRRDLSLGDA